MGWVLTLLVVTATLPNLEHRSGNDDGCLDTGDATQAFERAVRAFDRLELDEATTEVRQLEQTLGPCAWATQARRLLARTYALHGRVHLLAKRPTEATALFSLAARLDTTEVPHETDWPPPARAHYEAARTQQGQRVAGTLTLRVTPAHATLWLDGQALGSGATTLTEVAAGGHHLVARADGYVSAATVFEVHEPPLLTELSLFLEPRSKDPSGGVVLHEAPVTTLGTTDAPIPSPATPPVQPRLTRHWPWAVLGATLMGSAALWAVLQRPEPKVDIVLGRPQ